MESHGDTRRASKGQLIFRSGPRKCQFRGPCENCRSQATSSSPTGANARVRSALQEQAGNSADRLGP
eukprot:10979593-Alexandrium_andersonii.AAC.1